ncbi:ARM repeat-containing protein [Linderina pennispora]|uniref:ARM repeat-containing protein n=1 Tax=Linderina pennispora TaxID=61395 RepID=A0A1Y1VW37_9FUNG|nr:ARM repeat-containing protein [Linderina pennispora]ORX65235.1 ARM repeat-containing protein [Linderina pennispora]
MADAEDYSSLPLEQRLTHKVWKLKTLDPDHDGARFNMVEQYLTKMILDTNMAAQEAGVATVMAFVENAPSPLRYRSEIVAGVVSKCIASTKAVTRTQSVELLMLLSEADTPGPVIEGVVEGFDAKTPKAIAAAVAWIKAFVRSEAQALAVELYRWIGQALVPSLQDLQPVLLKELETQFAKVAGEPRPTQKRLLRSQREVDEPQSDESAGAADEGAGGGNEEGDDVDGGMDAWELADPVDITKKLPDDFHALVTSKKWKERKEVIEALHETLQKSVRLQPNSATGDLIQDMGKRITDTNIIVATIVIQCLGQFAGTMRSAFAPYAQSTLPGLVEKSKERKQTVIDAIRVTMDNYFIAVSRDLSAIGDHYFTGATHKNPQVRAEAAHFLRRCLSEVSTKPSKSDVKRYSEQLKAGLDDGDASVREASAECLGTLGKLVTMKVLEPFIEGIDKIKMEKVTEYMDKAAVKAKAEKPVAKPPPARSGARPVAARPGARPAPGSKPAPRAKPVPPKPAPVEEAPKGGKARWTRGICPGSCVKESSARGSSSSCCCSKGQQPHLLVLLALQAAAPVKKPLSARPPAAAATKAGGSAASAATAGGGSKGADDTVRMRFANDDNLDERLADALPAEALTGLQSAKWKDRVEAMDMLKQHLEDQAAGWFSKKPGWKESNFQVTSRVFQVIEWMASERSLEFNTGAAALSIPHLGNALIAIAERFTLKFLLGQAIEPIKSQKSPKVVADCLVWVDSLLLEFGIKGLALRPIVSMVKESGLMSSNAQTRAKAVTVKDLVEDLNPQLMQLLDAEFDKDGHGSGAAANATLLPNTIYKMLNDADWKKRKEGLTAIQTALETANHRIQPSIPSEIYASLKLRLQDSNKNLIAVALGILGALSTDSGAAQATSVRICMSDKKAAGAQRCCIRPMTAWATATPGCVDQAILPAQKGRLPDLSHISESLFSCLQDRNADVRKQAKRVLALLVDSCGFEAVHSMCNTQLKDVAKGTRIGGEPKRSAAAAATPSRRVVERAMSPVAEPVMTASELIGRATGVGHAATAPASPAQASGPTVGGPGMLRRPMAVKRPAGASPSVSLSSMRPKIIRGPSSGASSRPASSLRANTPSQGQSMAHMSNEELEGVPPVLDSDTRAKEQRARKDMAMSARNRGDLEAQLKQEIGHHFNPLDRDYLNGLTILDEVLAIPALSQERYGLPLSLAVRFMANIDLVLKYVSIRMYDGSTHTLLNPGTTWSEYEASAILPALISRLGDSKEAVRARARRLLGQQVAHLYPTTKLSRIRQESLDAVCYLIRERTAGLGLSAVCSQPSRIIPLIAQGIADRDSNVRTSTLNVLVAIGSRMSQAPAAGGRSRIGRPTGAPRGVTSGISRLNRPAQVSESAPPSVTGHGSKSPAPFPEQAAQPPPPAPVSSSSRPSYTSRPVFTPRFQIALNLPQYSAATTEYQTGLALNRSNATSRLSEGIRAISATPVEPAEPAISSPFPTPPTSLPGSRIGGGMRNSESAGSGIGRPMSFAGYGLGMPQYRRQADFASMSEPEREHGDDPKATEMAIERLQAILDSLDHPSGNESRFNSPGVAHIRHNISNIVSGMAMQSTLHRIRKLTNNVLLELFSDPRLALAVPQSTLSTLLEELIRRIVDPALKSGEPGASHFRDREQLFKGSMRLSSRFWTRLTAPAFSRSVWPTRHQQVLTWIVQNFGDMTMKCLWRLSKSLPSDTERQFGPFAGTTLPLNIGRPPFGDPRRHPSLRLEPIIRAAHRHFVVIPESEWYKREDKSKWLHGDMPKRTVKTITHTLITVIRRNIWQFTGLLIKDHAPYAGSDDDPHLVSWVEETSAQLAQLSDMWSSISNVLRQIEPGSELPTMSQLVKALTVANEASGPIMEEDFDDDRTVHSGSSRNGGYDGARRSPLQDRARELSQLSSSIANPGSAQGSNGTPMSRIAAPVTSRIGSPMRNRPVSMASRPSPLHERVGISGGSSSARQQPSLARPTGNTDMDAYPRKSINHK